MSTMTFRRLGRILPTLALLTTGVAGPRSRATPTRWVHGADPAPGAAILYELRRFRVMGSVLHVAAHPDDENTQLIAYLAHGRAYRAAYLSLTRGDGGQNLLGPELGPELGVARTQELLAARRLDGGSQFFTRALDFGFSKDYKETLAIWDHQQVLSDVVRVIRRFRPDVIVTRFSTVPGNTHGHHTASAVIALEAFKLAGDSTAFPDQLKTLRPWQPRRIFMNAGGGPGALRMDIGGEDSVLGLPFATVAAESRAMHKTQGFGQTGGGPGGARGGAGAGARLETFQLLAGDSASSDIMQGIDTTWARIPDGAPIGTLTNDVIANFSPQDPAASVPALLDIRTRVLAIARRCSDNCETMDPIVADKRALLDHIIQECVGLSFSTQVASAEVVPGERVTLHHSAMVKSTVPVRWLGARYPGMYRGPSDAVALRANVPAGRDASVTIDPRTPLSQPYWLQLDATPGMFRVADPSLIGLPENPPVFPISERFEIGGQVLELPDQPVQVMADSTKGDARRPLDIVAPISLAFEPEVSIFAPGSSHQVVVVVTADRAAMSGTLHLEPTDSAAARRGSATPFVIAPASLPFHLAAIGDRARLAFTITAPASPSTENLTAVATVNGARYDNQRIVIHYDHIPIQLLQPPARLKAVSVDLATRGHTVGYLPGAGDDTPAAMEQMGYRVTRFTPADLLPDSFPARLRGLDAVVIGIRASNVRTDLAAALPALFAYVAAGGTVVAQYNQNTGLRTTTLAPYPLTLSADRVTDETAAVTFLVPDHPVLNVPNKITAADFIGWVQEQGIYYPSQWDPHFTPILASHDPGEAPLDGGLLIAPYGHGYFAYTGLVFFRQLPAGVPGAYRLFANLLALGK
ncbi:MAG TPA: PIG-L family deacetylase [Gemmatimonadaceae bacterium]|nr:PIG-L family deacetylase [Gemmatimonadaceae bacterium]